MMNTGFFCDFKDLRVFASEKQANKFVENYTRGFDDEDRSCFVFERDVVMDDDLEVTQK